MSTANHPTNRGARLWEPDAAAMDFVTLSIRAQRARDRVVGGLVGAATVWLGRSLWAILRFFGYLFAALFDPEVRRQIETAQATFEARERPRVLVARGDAPPPTPSPANDKRPARAA